AVSGLQGVLHRGRRDAEHLDQEGLDQDRQHQRGDDDDEQFAPERALALALAIRGLVVGADAVRTFVASSVVTSGVGLSGATAVLVGGALASATGSRVRRPVLFGRPGGRSVSGARLARLDIHGQAVPGTYAQLPVWSRRSLIRAALPRRSRR